MSEDDDFVHIFKPDDHTFTIDDFNNWENNHSALDPTLWIFLSFGMFILFLFICCSLFYIFSKKHSTHRHPSSAAILHPPPTAPTRYSIFRSSDSAHGMHSSLNRGFEQDRTDSDVPPDYTAVVLPSPPPECGSKVNRPRYPRVTNAKKVETPPPAYITVAPFQ